MGSSSSSQDLITTRSLSWCGFSFFWMTTPKEFRFHRRRRCTSGSGRRDSPWRLDIRIPTCQSLSLLREKIPCLIREHASIFGPKCFWEHTTL